MRIVQFDEDEFLPGSEQFQKVAIASKKQFPDINAFANQFGYARVESTAQKASLDQFARGMAHGYSVIHAVREILKIDLLSQSESSALILSSEWNMIDLIIDLPEQFIFFHWETTA